MISGGIGYTDLLVLPNEKLGHFDGNGGRERDREGRKGNVKRGTAEPDLKYNPGRNNITPQIFYDS